MKLLSRNMEGVRSNVPNKRIRAQYADFDVVCLQEVFRFGGAKKGKLAKGFPRKGVNLYTPGSWPIGSGLLTMSRIPFKHLPIRKARYPIPDWAALFSKWDFAAKGYFGVRLPWGWVFHTHMNAGGEIDDAMQREKEVSRLIRALPADGTLVVCGDLNLDPTRKDKQVEAWDKRSLDWLLSARRLEIAVRDEKDMILTRNLRVSSSGVLPAGGLSDHRALVIEV